MTDNSIPPTRICTKCFRELPLTDKCFYRNRVYKYGLTARCKECIRTESAGYRASRPGYDAKKRKEWRLAHPEQTKIADKKWRSEHPEQWKLLRKRSRLKHKDRDLQYQRKRRLENPERERHRQIKWAHKNPDKVRAKAQRRRARRINVASDFVMSDWTFTLNWWEGVCAYCGTQQGLRNPITAEHFIPLFADNCPGTIPANIISACLSCNSSKSDTPATEWLTDKYGPAKAKQILARITEFFQKVRKV